MNGDSAEQDKANGSSEIECQTQPDTSTEIKPEADPKVEPNGGSAEQTKANGAVEAQHEAQTDVKIAQTDTGIEKKAKV